MKLLLNIKRLVLYTNRKFKELLFWMRLENSEQWSRGRYSWVVCENFRSRERHSNQNKLISIFYRRECKSSPNNKLIEIKIKLRIHREKVHFSPQWTLEFINALANARALKYLEFISVKKVALFSRWINSYYFRIV